MSRISITAATKPGAGSNGSGGGSTTTGATKLTVATPGNVQVTFSPPAASDAPGTVVTLTATSAAGSPGIGWSGDAVGTTNPIKITMNKDMKVAANFK